MVWDLLGANKQDLEVLKMGAQVAKRDKDYKDDGRRVLYELHKMSTPYLTGDSLEKLTNLFIETLCGDIDARFPENVEERYEWETLDLCEYVKSTWTHASITALFGTHIFEIWPDIGRWLWEFDQHFQALLTKMPRFVIPKSYALRDEGQKMCEKWEADAIKAEEEGKIGNDPDWDPYWGLRFVRLRAHMLRKADMSTLSRAGNMMAFLWGVCILYKSQTPSKQC
jgi:hypothetical protein